MQACAFWLGMAHDGQCHMWLCCADSWDKRCMSRSCEHVYKCYWCASR